MALTARMMKTPMRNITNIIKKESSSLMKKYHHNSLPVKYPSKFYHIFCL